MINGKSYPTGICKNVLSKKDKNVKVIGHDNPTSTNLRGTCKTRSNGYVPNLNPSEARNGFLKNFLDRKMHKQ